MEPCAIQRGTRDTTPRDFSVRVIERAEDLTEAEDDANCEVQEASEEIAGCDDYPVALWKLRGSIECTD